MLIEEPVESTKTKIDLEIPSVFLVIDTRNVSVTSHHRLNDGLAADLRRVDAQLLLLVEIERQKIAFRLVHAVQIVAQLIDAAIVVNLSAPDFQFDDELLATVVHDEVRAGLIPGLCLDIIVAAAIDDGF